MQEHYVRVLVWKILMIEWKINQLLFVDDTALVADLEEKFCQLVKEFGECVGRRI